MGLHIKTGKAPHLGSRAPFLDQPYPTSNRLRSSNAAQFVLSLRDWDSWAVLDGILGDIDQDHRISALLYARNPNWNLLTTINPH